MTESFTSKSIQVEIILAEGDFGGGNTKIIKGLPVEATINKPGPPEKNTANISVYGLAYEDLAQMTTLSFMALESQKNLISISAGEDDGPLSPVFAGEISSAFANFNRAPSISLDIEAISGYYPQRISAAPTSINGEAQVDALISSWATEIGYTYQNYGVTGSVRNAVFTGSPMDKIQAAARHVGAELLIDDNQIVAMPSGGTRPGSIPLLSQSSGMEGYPMFNENGIVAKTLYRPDIQIGGLVKIESIVPKATGTWKVVRLKHDLSAYVPSGGPWQTTIEGQYVG